MFDELPNFGALIDQVQPLYVQSSALAHSALVDPKVWKKEGPKLDEVRTKIQKAQESWESLTKHQIDILKNTSRIYLAAQEMKESILATFEELATNLREAHE